MEKTPKGQIPNLKLIDFDLSFQWIENMVEEMLAKEGKRIIGTVQILLFSLIILHLKYLRESMIIGVIFGQLALFCIFWSLEYPLLMVILQIKF